MDEFEILFFELIFELGKKSIAELEAFFAEWKEELKRVSVDDVEWNFCKDVVELMIQKKREEMETIEYSSPGGVPLMAECMAWSMLN